MADVSLVRDAVAAIAKELEAGCFQNEYKKSIKMNLSPNPSETFCNQYDFGTL